MILDVVDFHKVELDDIYATHGSGPEGIYLGNMAPNLIPLTNHLPVGQRLHNINAIPVPPVHMSSSANRSDMVQPGSTMYPHQHNGGIVMYQGNQGIGALHSNEDVPNLPSPPLGNVDNDSKDVRMRKAVEELLAINPQKSEGFRELRSTARKYNVSKSTLNRRARDVASGASLDSIGGSHLRRSLSRGEDQVSLPRPINAISPTTPINESPATARIEVPPFTIKNLHSEALPSNFHESGLHSAPGGRPPYLSRELEPSHLREPDRFSSLGARSGRIEKPTPAEFFTTSRPGDAIGAELDQRERLMKAAKELIEMNGPGKKSGFKGLRKMARKYDVPRTTLNRRAQEIASGHRTRTNTGIMVDEELPERVACKTLNAGDSDPRGLKRVDGIHLQTIGQRPSTNCPEDLGPNYDPEQLHCQVICGTVRDILRGEYSDVRKVDLIW
eukprot:CAMPEP_0184684264 /NCGR_PEP_ID=MMETSP0312-20130426/14543_1 /TAXON_ID=31354 /ORGANISM="Compsopogon coeruleus, Strain SAG 36.94" /LENGTH=443 /DNA_ID=CAMNT_0027137271 /DNA_START=733 /DNA_END=2061 /DNA_ORIENTATION=-